MLRDNFEVTLKSILWFRFLYIINTIQVVQLINGQNVFIQEMLTKYRINLLIYFGNSNYLIFAYIIILSIFFHIATTKFLIKMKISVHQCIGSFVVQTIYYILSMPIILNSLYAILNQDQYAHFILFLLNVLLNVMYIYFNCQTSFYQIDGSFSRQSDEIIIYLFRIILCILKIKIPIIELQFTIILLESILLTIFQMKNTESNSHFILNLRIFLLVFGIAGIAKLDWIFILLLYVFLKNIIQSYKNRVQTNQLFIDKNQGQLKLLISQIVNYNQNDETFKLILIQRYFKLKFSNLQPNPYDDVKLQDRLMIERYFQQNIYKLYFLLLSQNQQKMKFLDFVFVKAYTYLIQQECQSKSKKDQQDNSWLIRIFVQQETNFDILEQARITKLIYFQNLIKTNINESKYFKMIKNQTSQFCIKMQKLKKKLETNIDLKSQTLQNSDIVDLKTIQAIQKYYYVFYGDHEKATQIGMKAKDQLGWDRSLNKKLQKNQIFLIQVSYLQKKWKILNPKAKYLEEYFKNQYLDNVLDLFPQFLRGHYEQQLINYVETEFVDKYQLKTFILKNNYIISCRISFYHEVLDNDLIINNVIEIEDNNNFLLFDQFGKIFGISEQLFYELQKLDEYSTQEINYSTFLDKAMIQFYIPGIEYQVLQLTSFQQCNQIEFQSYFSKNLNLDDCLQLKINFNLSEELLPSIKRSSSQNFRKIIQDDNQTQKNKKIQLLNPKFSMQFEQTQQCLNQDQNIFSQNFQLEYIQLNNCDYYYFILHFSDLKNNLESQDRSLKLETKTISKNRVIENNINMSVIEQIIEKKKISRNLKLQIMLIIILIVYVVCSIFVNKQSGNSEIKSYQTSINFLINPQALTFSYAGSFLLQWNRYCVESGLYNMSQYIEFQRQSKLNYAFTLWKGIHINYTLNLSKRSRELGMEMVDVIEYDKNNNKIITQMDYYSFYTISREKMVRVQKNTNYSNISTHDYSIFKANGFIRQNILTIFKFHDIVINDEIEYLKQKVEFSQTNFYLIEIIQIGCANVLSTALIFFIYIQVKLKNRIFFLLSLIEINSIKAQIIQTKELSQFTNYSSKSKKQYLINNKDSTEDFQQQKNNHTIQRLQNIKFSTKLYLIIPIVFMVCYGSQMIGAYYYRAFYYNNYKNSLLMTMNYIKFKKLFDSSILLGELIKTEHLIPSNPHYLINETETVELYLMYADNSTDLFNKILDDLIVSDYFNYTMKNLILSAFRKDLCLNFTRFLVFCNISQIKLPYKASDSYLSITQNGIGGVIQNYKKMVQQDYFIERQTLKYSKNNTQFINSQIHQNFYVQYAQDIQSCFFTCFSYFINESIYLSDLFIEAMSDYFNLTGIMQLFLNYLSILLLYILFSGFWIVYQYLQIHQIKFVLLLLEPKLVQKKGIHPMLVRIMNQI
ncbi:unnamed protein product (macronuclear) [Paramecium tetraurelia]|uniref:Transmembrane protein n=1 Tax=Paramecium tetraurelia TaxID=5888 RepID=A0CIK5_PARTE|nr:uncharacterized protein GSPATT00007757001 [Paramecium tetraurelia]CAK70622.1 unnamed protein product [Paramecium tetraurelia]|eukprot:XP_001438019.1 hypothetical protein (macronuclear) [Paramecium tetraurelia strain d4-2]